MIVVADTSPVCYLILIGEIDVLSKLFTQVLLPREVLDELLDDDAPPPVRSWANAPPPWISIRVLLRAPRAAPITVWIGSNRENERRSFWPNRSMAPSFWWMKSQLAALRPSEVCG